MVSALVTCGSVYISTVQEGSHLHGESVGNKGGSPGLTLTSDYLKNGTAHAVAQQARRGVRKDYRQQGSGTVLAKGEK